MLTLAESAWAPEASLYTDTHFLQPFDSSSVLLFPVCAAAGACPAPRVPSAGEDSGDRAWPCAHSPRPHHCLHWSWPRFPAGGIWTMRRASHHPLTHAFPGLGDLLGRPVAVSAHPHCPSQPKLPLGVPWPFVTFGESEVLRVPPRAAPLPCPSCSPLALPVQALPFLGLRFCPGAEWIPLLRGLWSVPLP